MSPEVLRGGSSGYDMVSTWRFADRHTVLVFVHNWTNHLQLTWKKRHHIKIVDSPDGMTTVILLLKCYKYPTYKILLKCKPVFFTGTWLEKRWICSKDLIWVYRREQPAFPSPLIFYIGSKVQWQQRIDLIFCSKYDKLYRSYLSSNFNRNSGH
jgi:hypothetical protein